MDQGLSAPHAFRSSDFLYTFTDAEDDMQPFWEAFPAAGGKRTVYMFTYADADKRRPSFEVPIAAQLSCHGSALGLVLAIQR